MKSILKEIFNMPLADEEIELQKKPKVSILTSELLDIAACTRAIQLWFQAAHHLTSGPGFIGDHTILYDSIYKDADEEFDGYIERALGLTQEEIIACPVMITSMALEYLQDMPELININAEKIVLAASEVINHHIQHISDVYKNLKNSGDLTLGLDDMLMSNANNYETKLYKLLQRTIK